MQNKASYRAPDSLTNAAQEIKRLAPDYTKIAGARAIAPFMDLAANRSTSFQHFLSGVRRIIQEGCQPPKACS